MKALKVAQEKDTAVIGSRYVLSTMIIYGYGVDVIHVFNHTGLMKILPNQRRNNG